MGRVKLRRGHTITVLAVGVQGPPAAPQRLVRGGYVGTRLRVVGATLPLAAPQRSALPRLDVRDRRACRARLDARRAKPNLRDLGCGVSCLTWDDGA
jgi:hypothetical protein